MLALFLAIIVFVIAIFIRYESCRLPLAFTVIVILLGLYINIWSGGDDETR